MLCNIYLDGFNQIFWPRQARKSHRLAPDECWVVVGETLNNLLNVFDKNNGFLKVFYYLF